MRLISDGDVNPSVATGLPESERLRLSVVGTNVLNLRYREYNNLLRYFANEPGWV